MLKTAFLIFLGCTGLSLNQAPGRDHNSSSSNETEGSPTKANCVKGWHAGKGRCYKVVPIPYNWPKSFSLCRSLKADLVDINSKRDFEELVNLLRSHYPDMGYTRLWTGGHDLSIEGQWQWTTSGKNVTYTKWVNNHKPTVCHGLHCMLLKGDTYEMQGGNCDTPHPFICQYIPLPPEELKKLQDASRRL